MSLLCTTDAFAQNPRNLNFSGIPEEKRPSDEQINQAVHIVRSYLILYRTPLQLLQAPALKVLEVENESNASRAGIQAGDYLEIYDSIRPDTIDTLRSAIKNAETLGKKQIAVVIFRDAKRIVKELNPGRMGVTLVEQ